MGIFSAIGGTIAKGLDFVSAVAVNPVKAVIHPIEATNQITQLRTSGSNEERINYIKNVGVTTVINAAAVAIPVSKVATAAKAAVSTVKGAVITTVAVPTLASAAISNPTKIYEAPQKLFNFETNVGQLIANPTLSNAKKVAVENPIITAAAGTAAVAAAGYGISSTVSNLLNTQAIRKNTEATLENKNTQPVQVIESPISQGSVVSQGSTPNIINIYQTPQPMTSAEIPISAPVGEQTKPKAKKKTTTKKKAKKKTKKKAPKKKKKTTTKRNVYK